MIDIGEWSICVGGRLERFIAVVAPSVAGERGGAGTRSVSQKHITKLPSTLLYSHNAYTSHKVSIVDNLEVIVQSPDREEKRVILLFDSMSIED